MQPLSFSVWCGFPASSAPLCWVIRARRTTTRKTPCAPFEAIRQGADGVELDVMLCGSGEVVVVHDDTLARVAGEVPGSGPAGAKHAAW